MTVEEHSRKDAAILSSELYDGLGFRVYPARSVFVFLFAPLPVAHSTRPPLPHIAALPSLVLQILALRFRFRA